MFCSYTCNLYPVLSLLCSVESVNGMGMSVVWVFTYLRLTLTIGYFNFKTYQHLSIYLTESLNRILLFTNRKIYNIQPDVELL